jgi:hypothetical protein
MRGRDLLAPLCVGALAVICCAGLPAVLAVLSGVTVVGLLGGGVALAVLAGCAVSLVGRGRRRRASALPSSRPRTGA